MRFRQVFLVGVALFGAAALARADVKPHGLIGDGMVLQQGMKVPLWGAADNDEAVTIRFQDKETKTTAKNGKWMVRLDGLKAGGPFPMTIEGKNKIELPNVFVGEVWVCSGQSNMEWPVSRSADAEKVIAASKNPNIRLIQIKHRISATPEKEVDAAWKECGPETIPNFSAVAYFFGKEIQKTQNVPVGLISTCWGGTPAESWTSRGTLESNPQLQPILDNFARSALAYLDAKEKYDAELRAMKAAGDKAKAEGKPPVALKEPLNPIRNPHRPASLYNGMVIPLQPYAMRGAIWYQGESNAGRAYQYRTLFPAMIADWRRDWKQGDFPFLFVQLAPFKKILSEPKDSDWAELREAQLMTTVKSPNTAMAVITDVGHETDIHPKWKEPVGNRLAQAARALAYGEKIVYSGPTYSEMKVDGNKAILSFKSVGAGLVAKDGALKGFTIAGEDRKFVNAQAAIEGDKIIVQCPDVSKPVAVRFGWADYPVVNLWNKDGFPASPFRTDNFPMLTGPKPTAANVTQAKPK